jgi:hypothetical protein
MREVRNLRVPAKLLRMRLQGRERTAWDASDWALDPTADRIPTAARLQLVRERVLANARRGRPDEVL